MDFVSAFAFHRRYQPDSPAVFFPDVQERPTTYRQLDVLVLNAAVKILAAGMRRGDIAKIKVSDSFVHAVLLLACARLGIVAVSGDAVEPIFAPKAVIHDSPLPSGGAQWNLIPIRMAVDADWCRAANESLPAELPPYQYNPDDLCRILLTSGSTGVPKAVALTYRMMEERFSSYLAGFGSDFPNCSRILCGMNLTTSLGYLFLFYLLSRGGFFSFDSVNFEKIANCVTEHKIEALITTPYTLAELIKYCENGRGRFPRKVSLVMTAGGLFAPQLRERVLSTLGEQVVLFYGTTETGVISSTNTAGQLGEVGVPIPGRQVEIVGVDDGPAAPGEVGRVRIVASSGDLPFFTPAGWQEKKSSPSYFPGDVGMKGDDGTIVIFGRADGLINVGGTKTSPERLEQIILNAPGILDCGVVSKRDELGIDRIVAFLVPQPFWNQSGFLTYCERNIARDFLPSKFALIPIIPRTPNNKIDREALARQA
jgi:acyl-coenzyme A synthetase/AMP-(fatty) acid ligase